MIDEHNRVGKRRTISFTLIHGTFARDADWVHNDTDPKLFRSKIRSELAKECDVHFDVVNWGYSGWPEKAMDNSNARRLFGVEELKKRLRTFDDVTPTDQRYIVAHSHAGNIALYALQEPKTLRKITGVICLSSPFLFHSPSILNRNLLFFSGLILLFIALKTQTLAAWAYVMFYATIMGTILASGNLDTTDKSVNNIIERLEKLRLAGKEQLSGENGRPAFLAIRPRRDEVTILFWITRSLGAFFRYLWQLVNRIGGWLLMAFMLSAVVGMALENLPFEVDFSSFQRIRSQIDQLVLTPMMIGATFILLVMAISQWSYAFDSVPWIASLDVKSEIVPWVGAEKKVLPTWGVIKHTHIQNQSPSKIAEWIRQRNLL